MTPNQLRAEVDQLVALLGEVGLLIKSRPTTVRPSNSLTWVSWPRTVEGLPSGGETVAEYRAILRAEEYTCLLKDGGIVQITYALRGLQLEKHRFCWIPAPVSVNSEDLDVAELTDLVDQGLEEAGLRVLEDDTAGEDLLLVAPVRFDFDLSAAADHHAACHLTFNRSTCRVPVFGPLSLGHFVRFVFRHFYPNEWSAEERLREWAVRAGPRMVTAAQESEMFIECRSGLGILARITRTLGR